MSIKFLSLSLIIVCAFSLDPPLWPQRFSQDFVQGDSKTQIYTTGRIWYDVKNNRQRCDVKNDYFDLLCTSVGQGSNTSCSQVIMNDNLYIWLPQKNKCCKCCTAAQGCKITPRDWLKQYQFAGQASLSEQKFYKWTQYDQPVNTSYYATEDQKRIPRKMEYGSYGIDFIMNTYSEAEISQTLFKIPSECQNDCPKQSFCTNFKQVNTMINYKGIFQAAIKSFKKPTSFKKIAKTQ